MCDYIYIEMIIKYIDTTLLRDYKIYYYYSNKNNNERRLHVVTECER